MVYTTRKECNRFCINNQRAVQRRPTSRLKNLEYADDHMPHCQFTTEKLDILEHKALRIGIEININKIKELCVMNRITNLYTIGSHKVEVLLMVQVWM